MTTRGEVDREGVKLARKLRRMVLAMMTMPIGVAAATAGACTGGKTDDGPNACAQVETTIPDAEALEGSAPDGGPCDRFVLFPCGAPPGIVARSSCFFSLTDCNSYCPTTPYYCNSHGSWCQDGAILDAGPAIMECHYCPNVAGRRPRGLRLPARRKSRSLGVYFAEQAHLEAASITAFRDLARELSVHGAPAELVTEARRAAKDEIRHARAMANLATRHGARPAKVRVKRHARIRSVAEIARDNAREGSREMVGALIATYQALHTNEPDLRALLSRIAEDECRHVALASAIASWVAARDTKPMP